MAWILYVEGPPDSINYGAMVIETREAQWVDLPASYPNGACGFGFADSHWVRCHYPAKSGFLKFTDTAAAGMDCRFYRVEST